MCGEKTKNNQGQPAQYPPVIVLESKARGKITCFAKPLRGFEHWLRPLSDAYHSLPEHYYHSTAQTVPWTQQYGEPGIEDIPGFRAAEGQYRERFIVTRDCWSPYKASALFEVGEGFLIILFPKIRDRRDFVIYDFCLQNLSVYPPDWPEDMIDNEDNFVKIRNILTQMTEIFENWARINS